MFASPVFVWNIWRFSYVLRPMQKLASEIINKVAWYCDRWAERSRLDLVMKVLCLSRGNFWKRNSSDVLYGSVTPGIESRVYWRVIVTFLTIFRILHCSLPQTQIRMFCRFNMWESCSLLASDISWNQIKRASGNGFLDAGSILPKFKALGSNCYLTELENDFQKLINWSK